MTTAYVRLESLGDGGFAHVYRARERASGKEVALKVARTAEGRSLLAEEAAILGRLSHPHIVRLAAADLTALEPFIATEPVGLETLRAVLLRGRPGILEARRLFSGIAAGVAEAHRKGIVHGDLKPENILLTEQGTPVLADFGLARATGSVELSGELRTRLAAGTAAYMAPEQLAGAPADERSDVWALGLILFELLAGELPQPGDALLALRPEVPQGLALLFARCYVRREKRPASAEEVVSTLRFQGLYVESAATMGGAAADLEKLAFEWENRLRGYGSLQESLVIGMCVSTIHPILWVVGFLLFVAYLCVEMARKSAARECVTSLSGWARGKPAALDGALGDPGFQARHPRVARSLQAGRGQTPVEAPAVVAGVSRAASTSNAHSCADSGVAMKLASDVRFRDT